MVMVTACRHGQTFNKKSSLILNSGQGNPLLWETRTNNAVTTTPTSGALETRFDSQFDEVYYYVSGGNY
jgi:hypothetical protein